MDYVYAVLILLVVGLVIVGEIMIAAAAKFTLEEEHVFFIKKQLLIPYRDITRVERDITFGNSRTGNLGYVIFYVNKAGMKDSFRTFKIARNARLWEKLVRKINEHNPGVLINNSV